MRVRFNYACRMDARTSERPKVEPRVVLEHFQRVQRRPIDAIDELERLVREWLYSKSLHCA